MRVHKSIKIVWIIVLFLSCKGLQTNKKPDISSIELDLSIDQFEKDLFEIDTNNLALSIEQLSKKYPDFYPFFRDVLMEWNTTKENDSLPGLESKIQSFITNKDIKGVYDSVKYAYSNLETIEKELVTAFKYYKYYYPDGPIPQKIITYVSTFRQLAMTLDTDLVGVGLDMHLGKDYAFYPTTGYPQYITDRFTPEHLTTHTMKVWAQQLLPEAPNINRFIDEITHKGKIYYFLELVLPDVENYIKMGYSKEQYDWCVNNETEIWEFFIEQKLLYETGSQKYMYYTEDGPTSMGMPPQSPGNVGTWLGWQIVRKFMQQNPEVSLKELFDIEDGQEILKQARYKPR